MELRARGADPGVTRRPGLHRGAAGRRHHRADPAHPGLRRGDGPGAARRNRGRRRTSGGPDRVATPSSRTCPTPSPRAAAAGPGRIRTAVLLPSWHQPGSAQLPVLLRPVRRPARPAGAGRQRCLPDLAVVRRAGLRGGHRGRPRHARAAGRAGIARSTATWPTRCWRTRSTRCTRRRSECGDLDLARVGDPGLVVRRVPVGAGRAAAAGRVPRRHGRRPGDRDGGCTTPTTPSATSADPATRRRSRRWSRTWRLSSMWQRGRPATPGP